MTVLGIENKEWLSDQALHQTLNRRLTPISIKLREHSKRGNRKDVGPIGKEKDCEISSSGHDIALAIQNSQQQQ